MKIDCKRHIRDIEKPEYITTNDFRNFPPNFPEDREYAQEAALKVGNYKASIFEAVYEAKDYISRNECRHLSIDISALNMIDALKVCVLSSTFHFAKYPDGKIRWFVRDENIKNQIELLSLDNTIVEIKKARKSYVDTEKGFVRNLTICK